MRKGKDGFYCRYVKRMLDIVCALSALTVFGWLYAIIAILVRFKIGKPIIFKQMRPGLNEKIFTLYKFRTMTDAKDEYGRLLSDGDRLTKFGQFLRNTSLDELPETWNILKGEMSIVGPRPQLVKDMVFMTPEQRMRHCVRPGLSGWAQVNGRNSIEWDDKLRYDLEYIGEISLKMDLKIILLTIVKSLKRESISYNGMATAEDFGDYLLNSGRIQSDEFNTKQEESKKILLISGRQ